MNQSKAHEGIANVYKAIADCHARMDTDVLLASALAALRVYIDRLAAIGDEPMAGAEDLKVARQLGNAITAGESSLAYFMKR